MSWVTLRGVAQHVVDRERLAVALRDRRGELRLSQPELAAKAQVSLSTINLMERSRRDGYRLVTKRQVEGALGWTPGSIDSLLAGGDATLAGPEPHADTPPPSTVVEMKQPADLPELLERMPEPVRELWERLATSIARDLTAGQDTANETTISDGMLAAETDFGPTYLITTAHAEPAKAQVEQAAEQLRRALELLRPDTKRSVR
jgi:transcriptional regulator with XRE-family HTH domain